MRIALAALAVVVLGCKRDDREVIFADRTRSTETRARASGQPDAPPRCAFGKITGRVVDEDDEAVQPMCEAMRDADRCLRDASSGGEELHFDVEVGNDGRASVARSDPGGDPVLISCIAAVLQTARFPAGAEREFCYFVSVP